jgi:hypothetical protein
MKNILPILIIFSAFHIFGQSEPSWIKSHPQDSNYYIGIGSSKSTSKSVDYQKALIQARLNLAAEISTKIEAETEIKTNDSSTGSYSESFTEKINQSVEQYLKELEVVDSFYSPDQGYWVYIRLNKNRWNEIQNNEMSQLLTRIQQLIGDDYFGSRLTTSDKLFKIASASVILEESPYSKILSGDLGTDYRGNVIDFLISEIYRLSTGLSIETEDKEFTIETGNSLNLAISLKSSDTYAGKLPLTFMRDNEIIKTTYSDINGNIRVILQSSQFSPGTNKLNLFIDPVKLGFPDKKIYTENFMTLQKELNLSLQTSSLYISINSNRNDLNYLHDPISSLFTSGDEAFSVSEDNSHATYDIQVTLNFTEYPRVLENAPLMAGLDCIISLKKGSRILYEYKNAPLKDGGLTYDQAYLRVFNKLLTTLKDDRTYIRSIENEISR